MSLQTNHKLKSVIDILINRQDIKRIQQKPLVLKYILQSEQEQKKETICYNGYLEANNKSLSDVYDIYDNNNRINSQTNSIQQHPYPNNNNSFIKYPKDKVEKIGNLETTSYTSYTSDRPDRLGPLHRKYQHSDIWACDNCTLTGDWWFMEKHPCKNNKK